MKNEVIIQSFFPLKIERKVSAITDINIIVEFSVRVLFLEHVPKYPYSIHDNIIEIKDSI